jgi:DNA-directed RNA polymerase subunit RPC12/RpoP
MNEFIQPAAAISPSDVIFECPHCGKSLVIDRQAVGLVIVCPDCQARIEVPGAVDTTAQDLAGAAATGDQTRREGYFDSHLEQIGNEIGLIQASLDRIVSILADAGRGTSKNLY